MSVLHRDFVKIVTEGMGMEKIRDDVAQALTQDVEYRLREIIQEAKKFMRHSRRNFLSTQDINSSLTVKNIEPLYGFVAPRPVKFKKAENHIYYLEDEELDFDKVLSMPLPKLPVEVNLTAHWLAIDGVQPAIPENPPPNYAEKRPVAAPTPTATVGPALNVPGALAPSAPSVLVKDVLSKELQVYYEKITEAVTHGTKTLREIALASVATDPGLQPLLPYFIKFAQEKVTKNLKNLPVLASMVSFLDHILKNTNFFMEPYLHQLIPILLTTVVGKQLCADPTQEDHWTLRRFAAKLLATILDRYSEQYPTLLPRVTKTLLVALVDDSKPLSTKYGAVAALALLGPEVCRLCLVPHAAKYAQDVFEPTLGLDEGVESNTPTVSKYARTDAQELLDVYARALASLEKAELETQRATQPTSEEAMDEDPSHERILSQYGPVLGPAVLSRL